MTLRNQVGVVSCHLMPADAASAGQVLERARAHGLDSVEWFEAQPGPWTSPPAAAEVQELSREYGIEASYHAPYLGDWRLCAGSRAEACSVARGMLERARRIGADRITVHLGTPVGGESREDALKTAVEALASVLEPARKHGVRFLIENNPPGKQGDSDALGARVDDFLFVFSELPADVVGWTLDTGHAVLSGNLDALLSALGPRLGNIHVHDSDGKTDGHLPPGTGILDWNLLFWRLRALGYAGPITLEFPERSGKYSEVIRQLRSLHEVS